MHDDARVPLLGPDDVTGSTRQLFEALLRERGNIPNLFRAAAHRPDIVETLFAHMRAVLGGGDVPALLKELLTLRVSELNGCEY
ncbi:MAG: carboxymuconolactone decarboxylase family protein [Gemmatimonadota bacterium]|nr:carboxymuconolactone decarboxylase family protein [Gemmatimonadota bacterium]